jgi:hypothetical protein
MVEVIKISPHDPQVDALLAHVKEQRAKLLAAMDEREERIARGEVSRDAAFEEKLSETPFGDLYYRNGELLVLSKVNDPGWVRGSKDWDKVGMGNTAIFVIGVDIKRDDRQLECIAMTVGRMDDRSQVGHQGTAAWGEWEDFVRGPGGSTDGAMYRQMRKRWDGIEVYDHAAGGYFKLTAAGMVATQPGGGSVPTPGSYGGWVVNGENREWHDPGGIIWFAVQADKMNVVYQNKVQYVPDNKTAIAYGRMLEGFTEMRSAPPAPTHPPTQPPVTQPPVTPPTQHKYVAHFPHRGKMWDVEAGDFATLERKTSEGGVFGFPFEQGVKDEYYEAVSDSGEQVAWDAVIALGKRKDEGNE